MAVLKWDDVAFNPVAARGGATAAALLNDGITGFSDALGKYEARQTKEAGVAGIAEGMKYTTAEEYRNAAKQGKLQINESNIDFFTGREKELLANEQTGVQTQGMRIDNQGKLIDNKGKEVTIEGWRIDNQGKIIDNEGKVIGNNQQALALEESKYNFDRTKSQHVAQLEAAPVFARMSQLADAGTAEGRRQANELAVANAPLFIKAGQSLSDVKGISGDIRTQVENGIKTNEAVITGAKTADASAQEAAGKELFQKFYNNNSYINYNDAVKALNAGPGTAEAKAHAAKLLEDNKAIMYPNDPDIETTLFDQGQREGAKPQAKPTGGALYDLVTGRESANRWDALYGQSQGKGGAFEGVDVTRMTIADLDKFSQDYGPWVAERNKGVTATPMGMFQIVNKTLQQAAKEMGLPADTVFDADTQTKIFQHLVEGRIGGPRSMQTKLDGMRKEWDALNGVSDTQLAAAITSYEQGDRNALSSLLDPAQQTAAAKDPAIVENALTAAAQSGQPLNYQLNQALFDSAKQKDAYATQLIQTMALDQSFGGDKAAVLQTLLRPQANMSIDQRGKMIKDAYNEVTPDKLDEKAEETPGSNLAQFTAEVDRVASKYSLTPDQAVAFVKGATGKASWYEFWEGNLKTNQGKIDDYIKSMVNFDEKDPQARIKGAITELQAQAVKSTGAANIKQYQQAYQNAMTDYYSAAERRKAGQPVDDSLALKRVLAYGQRLQAELDRLNANPVSTANIAAVRQQ